MSSFENDIQNVFEGVEFQPSERVWAGVEAALVPKKKKGIFFMWQTYGIAAGIAALLSFGFLLNNGFFNNGSNLPAKELSKAAEIEKDSLSTEPNKTSGNAIKEQSGADADADAVASSENEKEDKEGNSNSGIAPANDLLVKHQASNSLKSENLKSTGEDNQYSSALEDQSNNGFEIIALDESVSEIQLAGQKPYRASLAAEKLIFNSKMDMNPMIGLAGLYASTQVPDLTSFNRERSINGSLGNSVLNLSSTGSSANSIADIRDPSSMNFLAANVDSGEDQALGAISAGFGLTLDLNRRWSMNLGARYSEFRFKNSSNAYSIEDGKSLPIYGPIGFNPDNVFFVGDYDLENTVQSLFLQSTFSYEVLSFGKFDIAIRAGVGIDYFLAYKVKGELNFLDTRKVNASESDFLNRTNLSGVSGIGLNYRLNNQFGLSGDISYRKFLTGSGNDVNSTPSSVLGFGLSLNYFLTRKEE